MPRRQVKRSKVNRRKGREVRIGQDGIEDSKLFKPVYGKALLPTQGFIPREEDRSKVAQQFWVKKHSRRPIGTHLPTGQRVFEDTRYGERRGTRKKRSKKD